MHDADDADADVSVPDSRRRLVRNVSWNYGAGLASILGLVLLYPWAVALAGAAPYGLWVLAFGATQLLVMADFGIGDGIVRRMGAMSRDGEPAAQIKSFVAVALMVFACLALVLTVLYLILVPLYLQAVPTGGVAGGDRHVVVIAGAAALFLAITARGTNAVLWALDRQDIERKATLAGLGVRVVGFVVVAQLGSGLAGVVAAEVAGAAVSPAVCGAAVLRRFGWPRLTAQGVRRHARPLLRLSSVLFAGSLASLAAFQLPLFVVGASLGLVATTAYGALMRVYQSARMVNSWTANPFIHALSSATPQELPARARTCITATLLVGTAMAVVVGGLAPDIVVAWLGEDFAFAAPALALLPIAMLGDALAKPSALVVNLRGRPVVVSGLHILLLALTLVAVLVATRTESLTLIVLGMGVGVVAVAPCYLIAATRVLGASPLPTRPLLYVAYVTVAAFAYGLVRLVGALLAPWPAVLTVGGAGAVLLAAALLARRRIAARRAV